MNIGSVSQPTVFSLDVFGRYVCNTFEEALANSDPGFRASASDINGNPLPPRGDMRPFDFVIVGGGTFGSALAEHLWFRSTGRSERILVLEGGPFLVAEHQQNLPQMSPLSEVWGQAWNANTGFPGLAYCLGGRSIFWGGWSPRLLMSETPTSAWPQAVLDDLNIPVQPNGENGYFRQSGQQIGVTVTNDFIFGDLQNALRDVLYNAITSGKVTEAMDPAALPEAPTIEILNAVPSLEQLAAMLGVPLPNPLPANPGDLAKLENEWCDKLKLDAPLAVQAKPEHAGFFPINKFSAAPLLIKAARGAYFESPNDDVRKRVMVVPRCHVSRLQVVTEPDGQQRVNAVITERGAIPLSPDCKVIIALGTIESTHLALVSFGSDGLIGTNLMAHLRSNITIRVPRAAFSTISPAVTALQSSALILKGEHAYLKPDGTPEGTVGHFHLQITASGLGNTDTNSEAELFQKIPDVDTVNHHLHASDSTVVITIRAIGEMQPRNPQSNITLDLNPSQTDYGERKAFVNLFASSLDMQMWDAIDRASDQVVAAFANGQPVDLIVGSGIVASGIDATTLATVLPSQIPDPMNPGKLKNNPARRDGLGTTHHEAGTLRMGTDPTTSVTDENARFHHVKNAYAIGPALFPTIGSPNPMLTGIALVRRLGDHLLPPPPVRALEAGFTSLFDGTQKAAGFFAQWLVASAPSGGKFKIVDRSLIAQPGFGGIGLLYYTGDQYDNFTLRLDFCLPHPRGTFNDNSGVFVRFRDPRKPELPGTPGPDVPGNLATVGVDTGYEIQIDEEARGDTRKNEPDGFFYNRTGAIYKVKNAGTGHGQQHYTNNQQLAPGVWHSLEITVTGRTYKVLLNGQPSTTFTADPADPNEKFRGRKVSEDPDSGFIGLQVHTGTVAFANLRIRKI